MRKIPPAPTVSGKKDELVGLAVFRLDFIATIRTDSGEFKKALIEIQKAKDQIDSMRLSFRWSASPTVTKPAWTSC